MKSDKSKSNCELRYNEDGVYLRVTGDEGNAASQEDLLKMIQDKGLENVDFNSVKLAFNLNDGTLHLIAPPQEEHYIDDFFEVDVSNGGMEARLTLYKGDEKGKRLNSNEVVNRINEEYKVTSGIDVEAIDTMINDSIYDQERTIAVGKPATEGIDGQVTYHFENNYNKVGAEVDGRIDYKKLNMFANVNRGDILATKTEPEPGIDGYDVYGNEIKAKESKEAKFQYGRNVLLSGDGKSLLASIDGKVDLVGNKVVVSKVYSVNGNVDMSVGNIDFNGDVVVSGNVMAGFEIRAGGSVDVYGIVEGAQIYAEDNIRIMGSFLGNGRGMLEAGGNVICKSVEQGIIKAGNSIEADVVMHSNLWCEGSIKVNGEKSSVIGGNIKSGKEIILNNVGNMKGTATRLVIGMPEDTLQRLAEIDEEREKLEKNIKNLEKVKNAAIAGTMEVSEKVKIINSLLDAQKALEKNTKAKEKLTSMVENAKNGKIEIRGRGYNGVDIYINDIVKKIDLTVDYTTFFVRNGEMNELPCK